MGGWCTIVMEVFWKLVKGELRKGLMCSLNAVQL